MSAPCEVCGVPIDHPAGHCTCLGHTTRRTALFERPAVIWDGKPWGTQYASRLVLVPAEKAPRFIVERLARDALGTDAWEPRAQGCKEWIETVLSALYWLATGKDKPTPPASSDEEGGAP